MFSEGLRGLSAAPDRWPGWTAPALVALASAIVLGAAYISQYGFGLEPCALCLWQRYPYMATVALGVLGALGGGFAPVRRGSLQLAALAFLVGAGIAGFHVGVEQGWWEGLPSCSAPSMVSPDMSVEDLRRALEQRAQVVPCDEPAFTLLGVSMAGYNLLTSLLLAAGTLWLARGRA
jgi:disulfide bond formation protein DsbB